MQHNINSLIGNRIEATDGEIGKVVEFYFDDETWTIRYLILKIENWISGRKVLISPEALVKGTTSSETFFINLTKKQVISSPDIDTDKPVFRQQEIELYGHYSWKGYWESGFYAGGLGSQIDSKENHKRVDVDLHLRSSNQLTGYEIFGIEGEIGHIKDFIIDDQTWKLIFLVIGTNHQLGGNNILVAAGHIKQLLWSDSEVYTDLKFSSIKDCSLFDESVYTSISS
jgi:sporulation protein YlmC with PRC-barrel domain